MKEKKEKKHREPTKWNLHVAEVRKKNPGMKSGDLYKLAKESYQK